MQSLILPEPLASSGSRRPRPGPPPPPPPPPPPVDQKLARGIVSLTPSGQVPEAAVLADPRVVAVTIRVNADDVWISAGVWDWSAVDAAVAACKAANKPFIFAFSTGGIHVPAWGVADCETFDFDDNGTTRTVPLFWDTALLDYKQEFDGYAAARYGAEPLLVMVSVGTMDARTPDWNFGVGNPEERAAFIAAGWTMATGLSLMQRVVRDAMTTWPRQDVRCAVGPVHTQLAEGLGATWLADQFIPWATATYGARWWLTKASAAAYLPDPRFIAPTTGWSIVRGVAPAQVLIQDLAPCTNDTSCPMDPGPPCNSDAMYRTTTALVTDGYGTAHERYEDDITDAGQNGAIQDQYDRYQAWPVKARPTNWYFDKAFTIPPAVGAYASRQTYNSTIMGGALTAICVYQHPSATAASPVVLLLHGAGTNQQAATVGQLDEIHNLIQAGTYEPCWIFCLAGGAEGFYVDSADKGLQMERFLWEQVAWCISTNGLTGDIHAVGFSMGGCGAACMGMSFGGIRIRSVVCCDPAIGTSVCPALGATGEWADLMLGGGVDYWNDVAGPFARLNRFHDQIKKRVDEGEFSIYLNPGPLMKDECDELSALLTSYGIDHKYDAEATGHNIKFLTTTTAKWTWLMSLPPRM